MKSYFLISAMVLASAFAGTGLGIYFFTPNEIQHSSGEVIFFPKTPDRKWSFYTVGKNLYCDDIIMENGELSLRAHSYSVSFITSRKLGADIFTDVCHLGDPA